MNDLDQSATNSNKIENSIEQLNNNQPMSAVISKVQTKVIDTLGSKVIQGSMSEVLNSLFGTGKKTKPFVITEALKNFVFFQKSETNVTIKNVSNFEDDFENYDRYDRGVIGANLLQENIIEEDFENVSEVEDFDDSVFEEFYEFEFDIEDTNYYLPEKKSISTFFVKQVAEKDRQMINSIIQEEKMRLKEIERQTREKIEKEEKENKKKEEIEERRKKILSVDNKETNVSEITGKNKFLKECKKIKEDFNNNVSQDIKKPKMNKIYSKLAQELREKREKEAITLTDEQKKKKEREDKFVNLFEAYEKLQKALDLKKDCKTFISKMKGEINTVDYILERIGGCFENTCSDDYTFAYYTVLSLKNEIPRLREQLENAEKEIVFERKSKINKIGNNTQSKITIIKNSSNKIINDRHFDIQAGQIIEKNIEEKKEQVIFKEEKDEVEEKDEKEKDEKEKDEVEEKDEKEKQPVFLTLKDLPSNLSLSQKMIMLKKEEEKRENYFKDKKGKEDKKKIENIRNEKREEFLKKQEKERAKNNQVVKMSVYKKTKEEIENEKEEEEALQDLISLITKKTFEYQNLEKKEKKIKEFVQKEKKIISTNFTVGDQEVKKFSPVVVTEKSNKKINRMCRSFIHKTRCNVRHCGFAHTLDQLEPDNCVNGNECEEFKLGTCLYLHNETKEQLIERLYPKNKVIIIKPTITKSADEKSGVFWGKMTKTFVNNVSDDVKQENQKRKLEEEIKRLQRLLKEKEGKIEKIEKQPISGLKSKVCSYGLKCNNNNCTFAHTFTELSPCLCNYGKDCQIRYSKNPCIFIHSDETKEEYTQRIGVYKILNENEKILNKKSKIYNHEVNPSGHKSTMCSLFIQGKCSRAICNFAHSVSELKPAICKFNSKCYFENCKYIHSYESKEEFCVRMKICRAPIKEIVKPVEVKPQVKPVEVKPQVKPVEVKPQVKPLEINPEVKKVEVKPEVKPLEIKKEVKTVEIKHEVKPLEVKPVETKNEKYIYNVLPLPSSYEQKIAMTSYEKSIKKPTPTIHPPLTQNRQSFYPPQHQSFYHQPQHQQSFYPPHQPPHQPQHQQSFYPPHQQSLYPPHQPQYQQSFYPPQHQSLSQYRYF